MLFAATKRAFFASVLALSLSTGCAGRWQPASTHDVATQADPQTAYGTVLEMAATKSYVVLSKDDANKKLRLQAQSNSKSFIDVEATAGLVKLSPAGALVKGSKVHKTLANEVNNFEMDLKAKLGSGAVATAPAASSSSGPVAAAAGDTSGVPLAWSEPAYDPSVWGNGNFTCLPVRVPAEHQAALSLQLTNGEKADLQLSLAYAPELCRSPAQCKQAGGCPALGIGDPERVNRIAGRLSRGEIGGTAVLLDSGKPVANIDLSKHGSIVQALSEIKR
jgi:hypothetical protein